VNQAILIGLVALLPVTALLTVVQTRPFYALISRGMMGAVAALIYAVMGAPDVALTEALMGTLLTILLYLIAVRSSMVIKVGWLADAIEETAPPESSCNPLFEPIRRCCRHHSLETEFVRFTDSSHLEADLDRGRIQAVFEPSPAAERDKAFTETIALKTHALRLSPKARFLYRLFQDYFKDREIKVIGAPPETEGPE